MATAVRTQIELHQTQAKIKRLRRQYMAELEGRVAPGEVLDLSEDDIVDDETAPSAQAA
jgi:hypothetical protein